MIYLFAKYYANFSEQRTDEHIWIKIMPEQQVSVSPMFTQSDVCISITRQEVLKSNFPLVLSNHPEINYQAIKAFYSGRYSDINFSQLEQLESTPSLADTLLNNKNLEKHLKTAHLV